MKMIIAGAIESDFQKNVSVLLCWAHLDCIVPDPKGFHLWPFQQCSVIQRPSGVQRGHQQDVFWQVELQKEKKNFSNYLYHFTT